MHYHRIPHSSLEVSTLGLGTMTFGEQNSEADATHSSTMPSQMALTLSTPPRCIRYRRARKHKG